MYIALVAVVALTACTKVDMEEIAPRKKVTFQVAGYAPMTKANNSVMSEFTSFTAKAYLYAEGYVGNNQTPQDFFGASGTTIRAYDANNAVTETLGADRYWAPGHDYYWPKSENSYINFIAWYDRRGVAPTTATETSLSWNNYTVQSDDNLLFADEAWRFNTNTSNGTQYDGDQVTSGVPMLFHHALAQVAFQAKLKSNATSNGFRTEITITNFALSGVYSTGSLSLTNSDPSTSATAKAWTKSSTCGWTPSAGSTSSLSDANTHELSTTATPLVSMRTVLPQSVDGMMLTLAYTVKTYKGNSETPTIVENMSLTDELNNLVPSITDWLMGHKITYTLEFDPTTDSIVFKPTLQSWEDFVGGGVTVE